jgi:hypothetical protein
MVARVWYVSSIYSMQLLFTYEIIVYKRITITTADVFLHAHARTRAYVCVCVACTHVKNDKEASTR